MRFTINHTDDGEIEVCIESERLEENQSLNVKFTHEGIIADLVDGGDVKKTMAATYDEFVEDLLSDCTIEG